MRLDTLLILILLLILFKNSVKETFAAGSPGTLTQLVANKGLLFRTRRNY